MKNYERWTFAPADASLQEILIAELNEAGFEAFEETEGALVAFVVEEESDNEAIASIASKYGVSTSHEVVAQQNWNAVWEASFEPVIVEGFCTIRADFHTLPVETPYEVVITPKMSFGTGHHATTQLMLEAMRELDFTDKTVFDFGTGTGILGIMAEKLGAASVLATDNDEWSYENAQENVERNGRTKMQVALGSVETTQDRTFDVILANINRHILLEYMAFLKSALRTGGDLLMSGLLQADADIIINSAQEAGLKFIRQWDRGGWIALRFQ